MKYVQMPGKSKYKFCKHDLILIAAILAAAVVFLVLFAILRGGTPGKSLRVTVEGREFGTFSLEDNRRIRIDSENGYNILVIENGAAWIEEADCPDQYCKRNGAVSSNGETIVCLPHRVVAEVRSEEAAEDDVDIIAY